MSMEAFAAEFERSDEPIDILSNEVLYSSASSKATFRGNVVATQGALRISSEVMEVLFASSKAKDTSANDGNKVEFIYLKDVVDIVNGKDHAKADSGEYDVGKGVLKLKGNVVLEQDGNTISGDELIHIKSTGESLMKHGSGKGRVKAHIIPNEGKHGGKERQR